MRFKTVITFVGVMAIMMVAMAADGHCRALAVSYGTNPNDLNATYTRAWCAGDSGNQVTQTGGIGGQPQTSVAWAWCGSSGAVAWAWADNGRTRTFATVWIRWGFAGATKADEVDSGFVAVDTTSVQINDVSGSVQMTLDGELRALPSVYTKINVELFQHGDTNDVFWTGEVNLNGGTGERTVIGFDTADFPVTTSGDTSIIEFNFIHGQTIPYDGHFDSVGCRLSADPVAGKPIPSLTPVGLSILVLLLLASGAWLHYRKRRAIV